ncbi:MAG: chemotaxis-specific protein-glutamate methyltransferase CheB [Acidobacteria bacterium]|nr:chemotaxis-specific protein-glutamate methyltransferase CheB [Acidobacteriota bacterium]
MIKVLVVEDSPVIREFLIHVLSSDPAIEVIATASNGEEALSAVKEIKPDLITMDIHMPRMNGLEATRRIMETHPTPIVIVSGSSNAREVATTFHAMEAGAVAFADRPKGIGHPDHEATAKELVQTVKLMAEVKVVRRWARLRRDELVTAVRPPLEVRPAPAVINLVAMGASTGGPLVLQTILSGIPINFSVPVLIVQHMAAGFIKGFVEWLAPTSALPIDVATHGEQILPGHAYIAPDAFQMKLASGKRLSLTQDEPENGHRPSVSCLFRSVAEVCGPKAVGVLLTGMGKDGAEELKRMREKGAVTIAQDQESSVVHGMPGEAIRLEAATYVLPPNRIAAALANLTNKRGAHEER